MLTCLKVLDIAIGRTALKLGPRNHFEIVVDGVEQNRTKPFCNEDLCFYEGSDLHDVVDMAVNIKVGGKVGLKWAAWDGKVGGRGCYGGWNRGKVGLRWAAWDV